jgi:hypothetical protein
VGLGAGRSIECGQEGFPLGGVKPKRPPVGKGFVSPRQGALQDELADRTVSHRRCRLQGALRMTGKPQVELLGTCGGRWHKSILNLRVTLLPAMSRQRDSTDSTKGRHEDELDRLAFDGCRASLDRLSLRLAATANTHRRF